MNPIQIQQNRARHGATPALTVALLAAGFAAAHATTDYDPAIWRPAPSGRWYTSGYGKKFYVIHDMEGYYLSTISYLQGNNTSVSVHYCSSGKSDYSGDAPGGEITQMVSDSYYAWTSACWNQHSMGTEHEGFRSNPAWYTPAMYEASSALTRSKSDKYGFAKDRNHIVGHDAEISAAWVNWAGPNLGIDPTCNTHNDPGPYWDWNGYMALVNPPPPSLGGIAGSRIKGDFNGDGKEDVAMAYNYGNNTMSLWVFRSTGSGVVPTQWWISQPGYWNAQQSQFVAGDFNGDGKSDIGVLYDYGNATCKLWVFLSNGSGFSSVTAWWSSNTGWWSGEASRLVTGDFTGDGKSDIGVLYDYGNATSKLWIFPSTGSSFAVPAAWWSSNVGWWNAKASKLVAGDFNGDGKSDVGMFYNYGGSTVGMWTFVSSGSGFASITEGWHSTTWGSWDRTTPISGNFTGDNKGDVALAYDYGNNTTSLTILNSTGTGFGIGTWWTSVTGWWNAGASQFVGGDFNGDGKADVGILYNYGGSTVGLWSFLSSGSGFSSMTEWWHDTNWGGWDRTRLF